ncbi:MAG: helix-turn-helix transcriptional regulator [Bacilli bacterium]
MYKTLFVSRKEKNLTQQQLAEKIGTSKQTYHLKEKGKSDFTVKEAKMLANIFGVTLDELFSN